MAKLARFYSVVGNRPDEPGALALMAEILCQSGTDEQISHAMTRCTRECRFPVRLPDLLQRIPGQEVPAAEAEARRAWEALTKFVDRWCRWNCERDSAYVEEGAPVLAQRIVDTVRRTGGWSAYLGLTPDNFPFQQKRFFEEYAAWTAVEKVSMSKLLADLPRLQLVAKPMSPQEAVEPLKLAAAPSMFKPRPIVEPMTDAHLQDRREMLRQQCEQMKTRLAEKA